MKLCRQFVSAMLIRYPHQFGAITERLQPLSVFRLQVGQPGSCIAELQQALSAASDLSDVLRADKRIETGARRLGVQNLGKVIGFVLFGFAQLLQMQSKALFQGMTTFGRIKEPGFDEGNSGHGEPHHETETEAHREATAPLLVG